MTNYRKDNNILPWQKYSFDQRLRMSAGFDKDDVDGDWSRITVYDIDFTFFRLYEREAVFKNFRKNLPQSQYAIIWEDPDDLDAPAKVTVPSPTWLGMATHGGILPPVEVYWALKEDEAHSNFKHHTRGHLLHNTPPMRAMTEEEAIEYLIMKDIPDRVWKDYKGNREILKIVPRHAIPTDRTYRNAWKIKQDQQVDQGELQ